MKSVYMLFKNNIFDIKCINNKICCYLAPNSLSRFVLELSGVFIVTFIFSLSYQYNQAKLTEDVALASTQVQITRDTSEHSVAYNNQINETVHVKQTSGSNSSVSSVIPTDDDIDDVNLLSRSVGEETNSNFTQQSLQNNNQKDVSSRRNSDVAVSGGANENSGQNSSVSRSFIVTSSTATPSISSPAENINSSSFSQINSFSDDNQLIDSSLSENLNVLSTSPAYGPIECPPIENFPISMQAGAIAIQRAKGCPI